MLRTIGILVIFVILLMLLLLFLFIQKAKWTHIVPTESPPKEKRSNLKLFMDGRQFFDALEQEILLAEHHIHVSFYIFRYDELGKTLIGFLKEKAKEGIQVRLLLDALGSRGISKKLRMELSIAGIEVLLSHRPSQWRPIQSLNNRNHRKIAVIDGKIGFFGGYNVGNEYIGRKSKMGHWRDYHVLVKGENVQDLQTCFLADWEHAANESLNTETSDFYPLLEPGQSVVKMIATPDAAELEKLYINHFEEAKERLFIGSPYFNPSKRVMETLLKLLKNGVSITILLPAKKDHPLVKPVSYKYFKPLLENGAQIFHYYLGFYHAKVFIVDHSSCYLGTSNFDRRSFFLNYEMNSFIYDEVFIREIEIKTKRDLLNAMEVTLDDLYKRSWLEKTKTVLSQPFAPLL